MKFEEKNDIIWKMGCDFPFSVTKTIFSKIATISSILVLF